MQESGLPQLTLFVFDEVDHVAIDALHVAAMDEARQLRIVLSYGEPWQQQGE